MAADVRFLSDTKMNELFLNHTASFRLLPAKGLTDEERVVLVEAARDHLRSRRYDVVVVYENPPYVLVTIPKP
jgi:hypothetical protein